MIAHLDVDAFFASVLQRTHPALKGKPLLALGMGGGCVIAASYEAKAQGVKTGMPLAEARKLCPHAIVRPSDFAETLRASRQIEEIIGRHCPVIQQYSIDEWFLDLTTIVGGIPADLTQWARALQTRIRQSTDMSVSLGIAESKILAKMASDYRKPGGVTVIFSSTPPPFDHAQGRREEGEIPLANFLRHRKATDIPGIGAARQVHAEAHHWETAWDIAQADPETIRRLFGRPGLELQRELLGACIDTVRNDTAPPRSISRCRSFPPSVDPSFLQAFLLQHLAYCTLTMRRHALQCRSLGVWIRDGQYRHHALRLRLPRALRTEEMLLPYALSLLQRLTKRHPRATQVGLALTDLTPEGPAQLSLFTPPQKVLADERLQSSLDMLRARFGRECILRGSQLPAHRKRERPWEMSIIED